MTSIPTPDEFCRDLPFSSCGMQHTVHCVAYRALYARMEAAERALVEIRSGRIVADDFDESMWKRTALRFQGIAKKNLAALEEK